MPIRIQTPLYTHNILILYSKTRPIYILYPILDNWKCRTLVENTINIPILNSKNTHFRQLTEKCRFVFKPHYILTIYSFYTKKTHILDNRKCRYWFQSTQTFYTKINSFYIPKYDQYTYFIQLTKSADSYFKPHYILILYSKTRPIYIFYIPKYDQYTYFIQLTAEH